jgi:OFA family oxalate/formate antiporter-like MFS transporter
VSGVIELHIARFITSLSSSIKPTFNTSMDSRPTTRIALPPRWPFDARKTPFFYGWVIWLFSTLGFLMSVPGQTMGMAVFTDPFMAAFDLSRTQLSFAYLCGTIGSAFFLTRAGRLYDRVGARLMVVGASVALGLLIAFISTIDWLGGAIAALLGLP